MADDRPYRVLIIDDDESVLEIFRDVFSNVEDIMIHTAMNSFLAGAKLEKEKPDLIVMDIMMPELDGVEFCEYLRKDPRFAQIPIIVITGLREDKRVNLALKAGANEVLYKPFDFNALLERIEYFKSQK